MSGILFIFFGPSGVGKTTLARLLLQEKELGLGGVCSYTTRAPRPGELDGVDYYFISEDEFNLKTKEGFFLEWSTAYGAFYGSSKELVENLLAKGNDLLLVLDRQGVQAAKNQIDGVVAIEIVPTSLDVLTQRIQQRSSLSYEELVFRTQKAAQELKEEQEKPLACHIVVNDDLELAFERLKAIILTEKFKKSGR